MNNRFQPILSRNAGPLALIVAVALTTVICVVAS